MKILILGGTVFLGRHLVDAACARGHAVTIFTRGQHEAGPAPEVEWLRGNRDGDLGALVGRQWDVAIDTSGYVPRVVRDSARLLAPTVGRYLFVSSVSAYDEARLRPGFDEEYPLATLEDPTTEAVTGETYGALKALCERAAEEALPGRAVIIRPGLIVGPYDPSDRFTYWPHRIARGGMVLAPGRPEAPVQLIDSRDLAAWMVRLAEAGTVGTFNATGPANPLTMAMVLETCRAVSGSDAELVWMDEAFLLGQGVGPWIEVPLWVPEAEGVNVSAVSISRALAAGLTFRPLAETVRDTLAWDATRPADQAWRAGLPPDRERELLAAWASQH